MLHFFRKHQKFFFIFITIFVVASFVFYGTYQAFSPAFGSRNDEVVFQTYTGKKIRRTYVDQMARFLSSEEWMNSPSQILGANVLNDGVISKDFLETKMALPLFLQNPSLFDEEFKRQCEREKSYTPYVHPYAKFINASSVWSMFSPAIPEKLEAVQKLDATSKEGVEARIDLFMAQRQFPPAFLSQVLRYQEQEYSKLPPDPRLQREDTALFGYHDLADWFGPRFIEKVCQTITNTAIYARKHGYKVTREEVLADLGNRSAKAYGMLKERVKLPVNNSAEFLNLVVRKMGLTEDDAVKIWGDVLLFRRLMDEVGNAALVDTLPFENFYTYAHEHATIEIYQLPAEFRFQNEGDLKKFEAYIKAVGHTWDETTNLPFDCDSPARIKERAAELVGQRYLLSVAEITNAQLEGKVSLKEMLDWECLPQNWETLKKQFPMLGTKTGSAFEILEGLEAKSRKLIDAFARREIVKSHPEWVEEGLAESTPKQKEIFLTAKSERPLVGVTDISKFRAALENPEELNCYTQTGEEFYRISVREKGEEEILTFKEALRLGVLDKAAEKVTAQGDPSKRFLAYLEKYGSGVIEGTLAKQWKAEKRMLTLTRCEPACVNIDETRDLVTGAVSTVRTDPKEGAFFYRFVDRSNETTLPMDKIIQMQEMLSKEARLNYFESLLKQFHA